MFYYRWSDSSPLDYTNWNPGEPNDANGEEQCAEIETFDGKELQEYDFSGLRIFS